MKAYQDSFLTFFDQAREQAGLRVDLSSLVPILLRSLVAGLAVLLTALAVAPLIGI